MALGDSYIADGFADDYDELKEQCLKESPVTFSVFSNIYKKMQLSCVFHDRQSEAEVAELSEELINMAKYYMLANTSNFEESVVGLFLVYALLELQPFEGFAYLRLTDDDVQYIQRIELVARRESRFDVLYCLGKVLIQHTRYTAAARERGMEESFRKYVENFTLENIGQRPKGVFLKQNAELDLLKDLSDIQLQYDAAKEAANVTDLNYVDTKLANRLNSSLKKIVTGIIEDDVGTDLEDDESVHETARSIKERAMKIKVNPMRHLIGIHTRSPQKRNKPHISDIKTQPGKIKTGSPTKVISRSKTQTNTNLPKEKPKKRKRPVHSSETEESDQSIRLSDHDSDYKDTELEKLDEVQLNPETTPENQIEIEIEGNHLNLGTLPCLITSENNGQSYEIEIIDHTKESTNTLSDRSGMKPEFKAAIDSDRLARKDKRDLKKTILKSRFKRMGMEPIANFKPS